MINTSYNRQYRLSVLASYADDCDDIITAEDIEAVAIAEEARMNRLRAYRQRYSSVRSPKQAGH